MATGITIQKSNGSNGVPKINGVTPGGTTAMTMSEALRGKTQRGVIMLSSNGVGPNFKVAMAEAEAQGYILNPCNGYVELYK